MSPLLCLLSYRTSNVVPLAGFEPASARVEAACSGSIEQASALSRSAISPFVVDATVTGTIGVRSDRANLQPRRKLASPAGFKPAACGFVIRCSIR